MFSYEVADRDKKAPTGHFTLYAVLVKYLDRFLIKLGHTYNKSFKGRVAWNTFINDGYNLFGHRGGLYDDEKGKEKIVDVVDIQYIIDEVHIKSNKEGIKYIEDLVRNKFTKFNFPKHINFSGKTEYIIVENTTEEKIKEIFNILRTN